MTYKKMITSTKFLHFLNISYYKKKYDNKHEIYKKELFT